MSQILEKTLHDPESNSVLPDTSKSLENSSKTVEIYPELQQHRPLTRAIGYSEQQLRMAGSLWLGDCLSILFALSLGLVIAVLFGHTVNHSAAFLVFSVAAYTLCIWSAGLYPGIGKHPAFELKHQALAIATSSTALIIGLSFVSSWRSPYSIAIVSAVPVLLVLLPISRGLVKSALRQLNWGVPCFYLGSSEDVNLVHSQMNKFGWTMLTPVGWFCDKDDQLLGNPQADSRDTAALAFTSHSPFMGDSSNLTKEAKLHGVHWLIYISQDPSHLNRDYPDFIEQFPQIVCARPPRSVARSGVAFISCGLANGVRIEDTLLNQVLLAALSVQQPVIRPVAGNPVAVGVQRANNRLPGLAILFLSTGISQRDGLVVAAGYVMIVLTIIYFAALALLAFGAGKSLLG